MPIGSEPPVQLLASSVFNTLTGYGYNSTSRTFTDGQGNAIYMFVERQSSSSDLGQWNYGTAAQVGVNPRAEIPQQTADIIMNGSYASASNTVSYQSHTYKFRLERDANGVHVASAVKIT